VNSAAPTIGAASIEQKMGRDHHFSIGMQQQIAPFTVAEVNYVGNIGRFLDGSHWRPGPGFGEPPARSVDLGAARPAVRDDPSELLDRLVPAIELRQHGAPPEVELDVLGLALEGRAILRLGPGVVPSRRQQGGILARTVGRHRRGRHRGLRRARIAPARAHDEDGDRGGPSEIHHGYCSRKLYMRTLT